MNCKVVWRFVAYSDGCITVTQNYRLTYLTFWDSVVAKITIQTNLVYI